MWRIMVSIKLPLVAFFFCLLEFGKAHDETTVARRFSTSTYTPSLRAGCDCSGLIAAAAPARALAVTADGDGVELRVLILACIVSLAAGCCLGGAFGWICFRQRRSPVVAPVVHCEAPTPPQVFVELGVGKQLPVDLVCCLDSSASVGKDAFLTSVGFVRDIVEKLEMPNSSVGVLAFHHEIIRSQELALTDDKDEVMERLERLSFEAGETRLANPLRLAAGMLTSHDRPKNRRKIILVVTDGDPNDPLDARRAADDLKGLGVELFVVQAGEADNPAATCALATTSNRSQLLLELKSYDLLCDSSPEVLQKLLDVSLYVRRAKCAVNLKNYKEVSNIRLVQGIDMMVAGWETQSEDSWNWEYHPDKIIYDRKTRPWDPSFAQPILPALPPHFTQTEPQSPERRTEVLLKEMQEMHSAELLFWQHGCSEGNEERRTLRESLEDERRLRQNNDDEHAAELGKISELKTQAELQIDALQRALNADREELNALKAASLEVTKKAYQEAIEQLKYHHDAQLKLESEQFGKTVEGMKTKHEAELSKTSLEAEVTHLKSTIAERDNHAKGFQAEITKLQNTVTDKERTIETLTKELAGSKNTVTDKERTIDTPTQAQTSGPSTESAAAATQTPPHVLAELAVGGQRPVDIVCCLDSSASVGCDGFEKSVSFFRHILEQLEMPNSEAGLLTFHHDYTVVSRPTGDKDQLLECLNNIHFEPGETNLAVPLKRAAEMLTHSDRSKDRRKIVLVVTDGDPNDLEEVTKTAADLKAMSGLELCFVLVGKAMNFQTFSSLASTSANGGLLLHKLRSYDELPLSASAVLEKVLEVYLYVRRAKYIIDLNCYEEADDVSDIDSTKKKGIDIPGWQAPGWQAVPDVGAQSGYDIMIPGWQASDNASWSWQPCPRQVLPDAKVWPWQSHTEHAFPIDSAKVGTSLDAAAQKAEAQPQNAAPEIKLGDHETSTPGLDAKGETADESMSFACQEKLAECTSGVDVLDGATGSTVVPSALPKMLSADLAGINIMDGPGQHSSHLLSALPEFFSADLADINLDASAEEGRSHLLSALPELISAHLAGINLMKDPEYDVQVQGACSTGTTDDFASQQAMIDEFDRQLQLLRQRRIDPSTD